MAVMYMGGGRVRGARDSGKGRGVVGYSGTCAVNEHFAYVACHGLGMYMVVVEWAWVG